MTRHTEPTGTRHSELGASYLPIKDALTCDNCRKLGIGSGTGAEREGAIQAKSLAWWDGRLLDPGSCGRKDFPDVPEHIASAADAAYKCRSTNALRAAILLARGMGVMEGVRTTRWATLADRQGDAARDI
jgi:hypothetical protein